MPTPGFSAALALLTTLAVAGAVAAAPPILPPAPPAGGGMYRPPSADEQKAFAEGLRAYEAGDARGAERAWKAGYAVNRDPAFLVRIAEAQEKAGTPQEAAQTYEQYLRESPRGADRPEIERRANRLNPRRQGAATADLDADAPGEMKGAPGADAPGAAPVMTSPAGTPAGPGAVAPAPPSDAPAPPPAATPQARDEMQDLMPLIEEEPSRSRLNTAAWIGTGVTTLLLGVAAYYGASASEKSGDANRLLTYRDEKTGIPQEYASRASQFEEDVRVGRRDDRLAKGFAIAAAAGAVTAAVLFIVDGNRPSPNREPSPRAGAALAPSRAARSIAPRVAAVPGSSARVGLIWSF